MCILTQLKKFPEKLRRYAPTKGEKREREEREEREIGVLGVNYYKSAFNSQIEELCILAKMLKI